MDQKNQARRSDTGRSRVLLGAVAIGAVILLALNIVSGGMFRSAKLDLTAESLFTLTDATRRVLGAIDEPINMHLYFSKALGERSPVHATYFARIRELLQQYAGLSGGKVRLAVHHPEPFSEAEDRAVAAGLQGVTITEAGELGYFGLYATNSTDVSAVVPFFAREREAFIEYDLTKMVHTLANPKKPVVGLLSGLPIDGGPGAAMGRGPRPWAITAQLSEFFELRPLGNDINAIDKDVAVLLVINPTTFTDNTLYAIDQFVIGGGRAMVFVDPHTDTAALAPPTGAPGADFSKLLTAWGVALVKDKVAGDLQAARRVNFGGAAAAIGDYVGWLGLDRSHLDTKDVALSDIQSLNIATAGILEPIDGATTKFSPLVRTGSQSMAIDAAKFVGRPDVAALFRDFVPANKRLTIAARISGDAASAYPGGAPKKADKEAAKPDGEAAKMPAHMAKSAKPVNLVVVSDADMLHDTFWVEVRNFLGQTVQVPTSNNADFVINVLDNLMGSEALIGLRGRGRAARPFTMVESIRLDAERQYRVKEKELRAKLEDVRKRLESYERPERAGAAGGGEAILSAKEKEAIEGFRAEMVSVRRDLRGVQHALRRDIETLDGWLKFLNIAAVPIVLALVMVLGGRLRRRRGNGPGHGGGKVPGVAGAAS